MADELPKPEHLVRDQANSGVALRRVLAALGPYREDLVLIGGWVPYLYQQFGGFPEWQVEIARTIELDLVVPSPLTAEQRQPLAEILVRAGFSAILRNEGAVWVREGAGDEIIELFTAHHGTARQIGTPRPVAGQTALAAISLTHLALLTEETQTLTIGSYGGEELTVRVPTLGGYVLNKALTFLERLSASDHGVSKAAKDIAYIRDVMAGGERVRSRVRSDIKVLVKRVKSRKSQIRTARDRLSHLTTDSTRVFDAAVGQVALQHGFRSDAAARADLLGYIEILSDLLSDIQAKANRRKGAGGIG